MKNKHVNSTDLPPYRRKGAPALITRHEEACIHLSRYDYGPHDIYNLPIAVTQDGIAHHIGTVRPAICMIMKQHPELFESRLAHCKGSRSKRRVYSLTYAGRTEAALAEVKLTAAGLNPESLYRPDKRLDDPAVFLQRALTEARLAVENIENSAVQPSLRYCAIEALANAIRALNENLRY